MGLFLSYCGIPGFPFRAESGMLGNFLSCIKGVNGPFEAQEGRWHVSRDVAVEKGLISC